MLFLVPFFTVLHTQNVFFGGSPFPLLFTKSLKVYTYTKKTNHTVKLQTKKRFITPRIKEMQNGFNWTIDSKQKRR